jgi:hypothetical protein
MKARNIAATLLMLSSLGCLGYAFWILFGIAIHVYSTVAFWAALSWAVAAVVLLLVSRLVVKPTKARQ